MLNKSRDVSNSETGKLSSPLIIGCGIKTERDQGLLYFPRVPSVATSQGEEAQQISEERRSRWNSAQ